MNEKRFVHVHMESEDAVLKRIIVDKQTKVQYLITDTGGTSQSVLVDSEGKPLLYEGEL